VGLLQPAASNGFFMFAMQATMFEVLELLLQMAVVLLRV